MRLKWKVHHWTGSILKEIPFLVVRAISDKADGSAQMDYSEFEKAAVDHSVRLTLNMLARI